MRPPAQGERTLRNSRKNVTVSLLGAVLLGLAACSGSSTPDAASAGPNQGGPGAVLQADPHRTVARAPTVGRPGAPGMGSSGGPVGVVTASASKGTLGLEIEAIGNAVANESVEITSKTSNTVTAIRFKEGELVKQGAVLVELDSAQARAELAGAEAALAESRSQFKRSRELFATQGAVAVAARPARSDAEGERSAVAAAQARLRRHRSSARRSTAASASGASASAAS